MPEYAQSLTYLFAVGTVFLQLVVVLVVLLRIVLKQFPRAIDVYVRKYGVLLAAVAALGGSVLSLWYSEVVGLPVCVLCWLGRTMMYPLAVILVVAVVRKSRDVWPYGLALAVCGAVITGYHHLYQMGLVKGSVCTTLSNGVDCARRYVFEFDYVTMPLMGFTMFVVIAGLLLLVRGDRKMDTSTT